MFRLTLNLLGPPEVHLDGAPITLDRQKALALLAYLAISGKPHGREHLAALLWPDLPGPRSQAALRQALWAIGQVLGSEWITSDRVRAQFNLSMVDLDVAAFRSAVSVARHSTGDLDALAAACARYRGDLLAGLELRDAAPFDEWRFFEAETLRADLVWALDTLTDGRVVQGDYSAALDAARRRLSLDPLHEPAHRRLMQLYAAAGQRSAALRQYEECARLLRAELDAEPEPATTQLYEQLRRQRSSPEPIVEAAPVFASRRPRPPRPTTPFIGREAELGTIAGLLDDPACRLISLLGPGGIGKTRLALAAAERAEPHFADGIAFVALANLEDAGEIPAAIATSLGLSSPHSDSLMSLIGDYLRERALLLVIDNLEHVIAGVDYLRVLLDDAPDLRMLVTSRERLGLPGEWNIDLAGLPVPADDHSFAASAALNLFAQAARRTSALHALREDDLPLAAQICRMVSGVPLAIELAAAWLRLMTLEQIADALRADLDFLSGSARNLPERHRGLRAVFAHSWRLLSPIEQRTFAMVAIFQGGFTLAAAEAVCAHQGSIAPTILALVDKSLVRRTDEQRYDLHALLRQYAAEYLHADAALLEQTRLAHARYYLDLLRTIEPQLKGANQRAAIAVLADEIHNWRIAWRSAITRVDQRALAAGIESLFIFYETRSLFEEGEEMFGRAANVLAATERPSSADQTVLLGNLLVRQGWFALRLYRFAAAQALMQWGLELLQDHLDRPDALVGSVIANFQGVTGGRISNRAILHEQLDRLRRGGDQWNLALALFWRGTASSSDDEARSYILQSLEVSRAAGKQRLIAQALSTLADLSRNSGNLDEPRALYREALLIDVELGARWSAAFTLDKMGYLARLGGDYVAAEAEHRQSLALSQGLGDRLGVAGSLDNLALLALDRGELAEAERLAREGLALRQTVGHAGSTGVSLETLGLVLLAKGDSETALRLMEECQEIRRSESEDWLLARIMNYIGRALLARNDLAGARLYTMQALRHALREAAPAELPAILADTAALLLAEGRVATASELAEAVIHRYGQLVPVRRRAQATLQQSGAPMVPPRSLDLIIAEVLS